MRCAAFLLAILLALPAVPFPSAGADSGCGTGCHDVRLYARMDGLLSPLPGDASQEELYSHGRDTLRTRTIALPTTLTLPAGGILRVHLDNRTATAPAEYVTRITLQDGSVVLEQVDFSAYEAGLPPQPPRAPFGPQVSGLPAATPPVNVTLPHPSVVVPSASPVIATARAQYNATTTNPILAVFKQIDAQCAYGSRNATLNDTARFGSTSVCGYYHGNGTDRTSQPCATDGPLGIGPLIWPDTYTLPFTNKKIPTAGGILRGQGISRESLGICQDGPLTPHGLVMTGGNQTPPPSNGSGPAPDPFDALPPAPPSQNVTAPLPSSVNVTPQPLPGQAPPGFLDDAVESQRAARENFSDFAFVLRTTITLPAGHALTVSVTPQCHSLQCEFPTFQMGRQDALTSVTLPLAGGPDASAFHPDADPILPGFHHGELPDEDAAHDYRFHANVGEGIIVSDGTLYDPAAQARAGRTRADVAGDWLIRVTRFHQQRIGYPQPTVVTLPTELPIGAFPASDHPTSTAARYQFELYVEPARAQDDAGSGADAGPAISPLPLVGSGTFEGNLSRFDDVDSYALRVPANVSATISLVKGAGLNSSLPWGETPLTSYAGSQDWTLNISVKWLAGEGSYHLNVLLSAPLDLSHAIAPRFIGKLPGRVVAMHGTENGVDITVRNTSGSDTLLTANLTNISVVRSAAGESDYVPAGHGVRLLQEFTLQGSLVMRLENASASPSPYMAGGQPLVFLADSSFVFWPGYNAVSRARTTPDGGWAYLPAGVSIDVVAPDGAAYGYDWWGAIQRYDLDSGAPTPVWLPPYSGYSRPLAFDSSGRAMALARVPKPGSPSQWTVTRFDPRVPGPYETLAIIGDDAFDYYPSMAASASGLFVTLPNGSLGVVPLDTPGFPGFLPDLPVKPLPNLVVSNASYTNETVADTGIQDSANEGHTVTLRVRNDGQASTFRGFSVYVYDPALTSHVAGYNVAGYGREIIVPRPLGAGAEVDLSFHVNATVSSGRHSLFITVDSHQESAESNESDNFATLDVIDRADHPA